MIVSAFVGATVGGLLSNLLWLFLARSEPPQDLPGLGGLVGIIGALIWTWSYLGGGERADLLRSRTIKGAWMALGAVGGFGALAMIVGLSVGALTGQSAPSSVGGVVLVAGPIVGLLITVPLLDGGRWGWSRLSPVASVWVLMIGAYLGSAVLLGMVSIWMGDVATASEGNEIAESPRPAAIAALAGLAVGAYIASRFLRVRNAAGSGNDR